MNTKINVDETKYENEELYLYNLKIHSTEWHKLLEQFQNITKLSHTDICNFDVINSVIKFIKISLHLGKIIHENDKNPNYAIGNIGLDCFDILLVRILSNIKENKILNDSEMIELSQEIKKIFAQEIQKI